jgi:hypothetical protein
MSKQYDSPDAFHRVLRVRPRTVAAEGELSVLDVAMIHGLVLDIIFVWCVRHLKS